MKIKRYEGKSEAALMPIIYEEMGQNVTIISVKQQPNTGLFGMFSKPRVVITAAYDEGDDFLNYNKSPSLDHGDAATYATTTTPAKKTSITPTIIPPPDTDNMEETMNLLLQEARKAATKIEVENKKPNKASKGNKDKKTSITPNNTASPASASSSEAGGSKYENKVVQLFYDTMISQDVRAEVAEYILQELDAIDNSAQVDVKMIIKAVYANVVEMLKNPQLIDPVKKDQPQIVVFMGPTGVGKTTTIAKLSSLLTLTYDMKVGLITADTYRIAAVEQLKTYADILGLDIRVVYSPDEMPTHLETLGAKNDIIFVDTAGRSHKNEAGIQELQALLETIPDSIKYLVMSVTTRYEDLCRIAEVYDKATDFSLIFTKLDEAETLGSLINICSLVGKKVAYVTFGQNVPDDMESVKPEKIAKSILGLAGGSSQPYAEGGDL